MTDAEIERVLRAANPQPPPHDFTWRDSEAGLMLQRVLTERPTAVEPVRPQRTFGKWPRRAVVLMAMALAIAGMSAKMLDHQTAAYAATPPMLDLASPEGDARARLQEIASRVRELPGGSTTDGAAHIVYSTWSLFTRIDGVDTRSSVVPETVTKDISPTGAAVITTTFTADGETHEQSDTSAYGDRIPLSSNPTGLRKQLDARNPSSAAGQINAVVETLLDTPATPGARAAICDYLASIPRLKYAGRVSDRAGREGEAFSLDSSASGLPTRYVLIVDSQTGSLLGYEEILIGDTGKLPVESPSVIEYVLWEQSDYVR